MACLFRRNPEDAPYAALDLEQGERVLASGRAASGEPVVATDRRLYVPEAGKFRPIAWDGVEKASWSTDEDALFVTETAVAGDRPRQHRIGLEGDGRLLDVIREQVTASVVISRHVPVDARRGVRVTGRRRSAGDGLRWVVTPDAGVDVTDAKVRSRVDAAVAAVRAEVE